MSFISSKYSEEYLFLNPDILLHPNIPKPLHGVNPRNILGDVWWNSKRLEVYSKNNYCCWACGVHKTDARYHRWLEAHEEYDINYKKGKVKLVGLVALCHSCHNFIHDGRMRMLVQSGDMDYGKMVDILDHGDRILKSNSLVKEHYTGKIAEWSKWYLLLNNKKYYSKFKDMNEWAEYFSNL